MKKIYSLSLFVMVAVGAFAQSVPFTGTGLLNANGWTTHSGTAGQVVILATASDSGNSLSKAGLAASTGNRTGIVAGNSEDLNYPLTAAITTTGYLSTLIKVTDTSTLNLNSATGDYSLGFTSVVGASTTAFQARVYFKQGATPNTFLIGILNNSGGTAAPSYVATDLTVNTTYLIVVKYDLTTNTASLFINPTPGAAEPTATVTNVTGTTAAAAQIAGFVIRQAGSATAGTGTMEIDEFRAGTTFASVTPANLSVKQNDIAGLSIYPNPVTNGTLNINSDANAERNVVLFDVLGKQVLKVTTSNASINVSKLNAGVYIVKITEEGKTATRKLVIQ
jgi:hypothetical protein